MPIGKPGADGRLVPYGIAKDMNTPSPDPGEEYQHVNTQLFGHIDPPSNRGVLAEHMVSPYNAPADPGRRPTMTGFVTDYISAFTAEMGRQPTHDEYSQIMTGYTPEQMPVLSRLARGFATFDHWFAEVPSRRSRPVVRGEASRPAGGRTRQVRELPDAQQRLDSVRAAGVQGPDVAGVLRPAEPGHVHWASSMVHACSGFPRTSLSD